MELMTVAKLAVLVVEVAPLTIAVSAAAGPLTQRREHLSVFSLGRAVRVCSIQPAGTSPSIECISKLFPLNLGRPLMLAISALNALTMSLAWRRDWGPT